ncbi:MgtC/SapB family protein [Patescibacteria group bacterium]|nr:MgtC/SapB family protein [Patescibacteria group bacterium]MBU2632886.1 MgtC/SapB family protein [Patescibacteria group bacterium]
MIDATSITMMFQILLAAVLGMFIGFEREKMGKPAGLRTYMLVSMGSALFTLMSVGGFVGFTGNGFDPSRIASQIVVGVGFLGAGIIFFTKTEVRGLTTAAAVWVSAAIGMAVGLKFYSIAIFSAVLTVLILWAVRFIESKIGTKKGLNEVS